MFTFGIIKYGWLQSQAPFESKNNSAAGKDVFSMLLRSYGNNEVDFFRVLYNF